VAVKVSVILDRKGRDVITIRPDAMLLAAAETLTTNNVGALVVSADGTTVDGIVSERDLVNELARRGTAAVKQTVADIMTAEVTTCAPDATVDDLTATMTERRVRHVPILDDGHLAGIVSIGDVVKTRLDELQVEKDSLEQYVTGGA
jgi:CBS domain-containing protein